MTAYLILRNSVEQATYTSGSGAFQGHKFAVVEGGYKPGYEKSLTVEKTITGHLDVTMGSVFYLASYTIKVYEELDATQLADNMGTYQDLLDYFLLNDPTPTSGSPSNLITLVDHYGVSHNGYLVGTHAPDPLTVTIEGLCAIFHIQIQFMQKDPLA